MPCRVYGLRRDLTEDVVDGNLTYRPFSEARFIDDLRTARAVVAGGGFTLMSEAVYLRKPMLSVPVERQFEQVLNALYLEELGYGTHARRLDEATLGAFLGRIPDHARALAGLPPGWEHGRAGHGEGAARAGGGPAHAEVWPPERPAEAERRAVPGDG